MAAKHLLRFCLDVLTARPFASYDKMVRAGGFVVTQAQWPLPAHPGHSGLIGNTA